MWGREREEVGGMVVIDGGEDGEGVIDGLIVDGVEVGSGGIVG